MTATGKTPLPSRRISERTALNGEARHEACPFRRTSGCNRSGNWQLAAALLLTSAGLACAQESINSTESPQHAPPFRIHHLAYTTNGALEPVSSSQPAAIKSLFYGEPVTNVVFGSELLSSANGNGNDDGGGKGALLAIRSKEPAPPRPLFRIDRWNREQGLPANKINALLQTRDGYLWIGTVGGLARFDGVRFTVFNDANTPEMRTNGSIGRALFEDDDGRLWIGTERGILCYAHGEFIPFTGQGEVHGVDIRCFTRRAAGGFWIGADQRLGFWDGSAIRWHLKNGRENESWDRIMSLAEVPGGYLWIGTVRGLWRLELNSGQAVQAGRGETAYNGMFLDRQQTLWIGSVRGVWRVPRGAREPVPIGGPDPAMRILPHSASFAEDADGTIWATTAFGDGLFQLHRKRDGVELVTVAEELNETLSVLADREGAIWIGARDLGLIRLRPQRISTVAFGSRAVLDHVRSVTESADGSVWFAGRAGVGHWAGREITLADTRGLGPQRTTPIFALPTGAVWTSYPTSGVFEPLFQRDSGGNFGPAVRILREVGEVQAISARRDGSVWIGTTNGLFRIPKLAQGGQVLHGPDRTPNSGGKGHEATPSRNQFVATANAPPLEKIKGLSNPNVRALLEDRLGRLWIGTARGLNCLDNGGDRAHCIGERLRGLSVGAFHDSGDGTLWIGTETGLSHLRDDRLAEFGEDSGLPQQAICCILEDDAGRLWISHAAGIARVARTDLEAWLQDPLQLPAVAEFGSADGILNPEMSGGSQPSGLKSRDGRLWFPNRGGLIVVDPSQCPNSPAPQVLIEEILADGKALASGSVAELAPGSGKSLDIRFTATSLSSPERLRFRYWLNGHDRDWHDVGVIRVASYTDLRPGRYTFHVQARNHEGRWSERDAIVQFHLAPHVWQTWSFRLASGLAATGLVAGFVSLRIRNQRRRLESERLRSLELERRRIARDMHDHLGAQLAGIALASGADPSAHQRVRESLRELNDLIWAVHPDNDTLASLADFIANFASRYLSAAGLKLDLDLPERIPATPIPSRLRHEVAAMFKEALRNVTQHARARNVVVSMRLDAARIAMTIGDDGQGFDATLVSDPRGSPVLNGTPRPLASGNGLHNFQVRSRELGGECRIRSVRGTGTEIEFIIPINRSL